MFSRKRTITIDNEEKYRAFLRRLPVYRSILFRFTEFEITGSCRPSELQDFQTALNIKNRRKRIVYLYERCCEIIDRYNSEHCITCRYSAEGICEDPKHQTRKNGCCCHCYLQSSDGCPTRNLSCKLYFCDHISNRYHPLTMEDINLLRMFTASQREIIKSNVFVTEKTYIRLLYIGSYLLFCMYSVIKLYRIKNV